jgi:Tfp pilus assembly protein PilO
MLSIVFAFAAGTAMLVWPGHRRKTEVDRRLASLREMVDSVDQRIVEVERLTAEVERMEQQLENDLRDIPARPDTVELIRRLSMPRDDVTVLDQSFLTSGPAAAVPGGDVRTKAMPVTVEMEASFDAVFALIDAAESMPRLVRVAGVKLSADRDRRKDAVVPFVTARVELDAIFEPDALSLEAE